MTTRWSPEAAGLSSPLEKALADDASGQGLQEIARGLERVYKRWHVAYDTRTELFAAIRRGAFTQRYEPGSPQYVVTGRSQPLFVAELDYQDGLDCGPDWDWERG